MDAYHHIERAKRQLSLIEDYYNGEGQAIDAVRALGNVNESLQELVMQPVQEAYDTARFSKQAIATALGIPVSTLRGLKKNRGEPVRAARKAKPTKNDGPEALKELLRLDQ